MYIAPGQEHTAPKGTKVRCQQKLLVPLVICCQFQIIDDNSFWKIHSFTFFSCKSIRDQIWPCRKICQGQLRDIIWANLIVLKHLMMHTKIQGHWPFGSEEKDFFRFLPYMAMAAILVMWQGPFEQGGTSVVVPYCSCCLCLYFGSSIMLMTYFVNFR